MIYLILDSRNKAVKIGYSKDVDARLQQLQVGHGSKLQILFVIPGTRGIEKAVQLRFRQFLIRGEWFEDNEEIRLFFQFVKRQVFTRHLSTTTVDGVLLSCLETPHRKNRSL